MHQSLRGRIVGALIYYYFADASTICDASMHDSAPCSSYLVDWLELLSMHTRWPVNNTRLSITAR